MNSKINTIFNFYANILKEKLKKDTENLSNFLKDLLIRSLSSCQKQLRDKEVTETDTYESMISFEEINHLLMMGTQKSFTRNFRKILKMFSGLITRI